MIVFFFFLNRIDVFFVFFLNCYWRIPVHYTTQSRWADRKERQRQQELKAAEEAAAAAAAAARAVAAATGRNPRGLPNGYLARRLPLEAFPLGETVNDFYLDDDEEDDDMPATLERLRDPRRRYSSESNASKHPEGSTSSSSARRNYNNGEGVRGSGSDAGRAGGGGGLHLAGGSASAPNRILVTNLTELEASPTPAYSGKPAPLTDLALATPHSPAPIEAKLERGKVQMEAPWVHQDNMGLVIEVNMLNGAKRLGAVTICHM